MLFLLKPILMLKLQMCLLLFIRVGGQDVEGPAQDALVMRSDDFTSAELPMEHREGELELPDVFSIPRSVSAELEVDLFFSLFFVFLNNDWKEYKGEAMLLAPAGLHSSEATRWLEKEEKLTEELLLSHIILGERIRPELLVQDQTRTTLGGMNVVFTLSDNGDVLVNGVRVLAMQNHENILIIALDDYLFKKEVTAELKELSKASYEMSSSELNVPREMMEGVEVFNEPSGIEYPTIENPDNADSSIDNIDTDYSAIIEYPTIDNSAADNLKITLPEPSPRNVEKNCTEIRNTSENSIFETIRICNEIVPQLKNISSEDEKDGRSSPEFLPQIINQSAHIQLNIIEQIEQMSSFFRGPSITEFITFARQMNISENLPNDQAFTIFVPLNEAFRDWTPIDWGFNPFNAEDFVNETLYNHIVQGYIDLHNIEDGTELETLGGEIIKVSVNPESTFVNSVATLGEMDLLRGKVVFIEHVLFLDDDKLEELIQEYGYLESGPLITYPWFKSQFLSHAVRILEDLPGFSSMYEYMNMTQELGDYANTLYAEDKKNGFTLLAPRDDAFWKISLADPSIPDPFIQNPDFRLQMLLGHLVPHRYLKPELYQTESIQTQANTTLSVSTNSSGLTLFDGEVYSVVLGDPLYVYNLGVIIPIDSVLFVSMSDILSELELFNAESEEGLAESKAITETNETTEPTDFETAETVTESLPDVIMDILAEDFMAVTSNSETTPSPLHSILEDSTEFMEPKEKEVRRIDYVLTYPTKHFLRNEDKYYSPVQESANDKIESFQQNSEKSVKKTKVYYVNNTRIEIEI